jgi:hypothetical protein
MINYFETGSSPAAVPRIKCLNYHLNQDLLPLWPLGLDVVLPEVALLLARFAARTGGRARALDIAVI